jgi:hypothetical protein
VKHIVFCLLFAVAGSAAADSMSEANRLLANKSYGEAFPVLRMLADGGNAEARLRLGQMYWYGKGVPADSAKADQLFAQAAAAGNQEAAQALTLSRRRAEHSADIAKWTGGYDGTDLTSGKYACAQPTIPDRSKTNEEIKATTAAYTAWAACYNGFVADLEGPLAPKNRIPAGLAELMTETEQQQAMANVANTTEAVIARVGANAGTTMARYESWEKATGSFAAEHNASVEAHNRQVKIMLENEERARASNSEASRATMPTPKK